MYTLKKFLKIYRTSPEKVLFLDIETEGLSKERNDVTIIGVYIKDTYYSFVKGENLEKAFYLLNITPIWITFGGSNFDLLFIKKTFPFLKDPEFHLDLFMFTRKIGLKGGLKKIEKALGIKRETDGMNGYDAVKLWQKWIVERDKKALEKLILYNKEDVVNLKKVLEIIIKNWEEVFYED